jgi:RNA polymerase sigma factor (sigma-70 family)
MINDATLLESYARDRSEDAFAELVQRHLTLVYSAALRRTDGDVHRAKDVAQIVFTGLARDAAVLCRHPALAAWLYAATRNAAIDLMRAERRRREREEKAHLMEENSSSREIAADWEQLRPVLDDVMFELDERDRAAVMLRFFEAQPFASVATALRVSEDAARKRVDRALDKLSALLRQRGITSASGALAVLLANQVCTAAPASVAASITAAAMAGAGAAAGASGAGAAGIFIMSTAKIVTGIAAVVALAAIGTAIYQSKISRESEAAAIAARTERDQLRTRLNTLEKRGAQADSATFAAQNVAPQPVNTPSPRSGSPQVLRAEYVYTHPETHAAFIEQQVLLSKARYDRFFRAAGLSAEKQEQLLNAIKEQQTGSLDLLAMLHDKGYSLENLPAQEQGTVIKIVTDMTRRREATERAILGDEGYKAYYDFRGTVTARNVADQVASQLYDTKEPLTGSQAEALVEILRQTPHDPAAASDPGNRVNGITVTKQARQARLQEETRPGGLSVIERLEPITDAAITRAQAVLTPAQLEVLKQVQARQATEFQVAPRTTPAAQSATSDK